MVSLSLFRKQYQTANADANHSAQRASPASARTETHHPASPLQIRYRLTVAPNDAIQFTSTEIGIRILSGGASLNFSGNSVALTAGEDRAFADLSEGLTIRAAGGGPLTFEVVLDSASDDHQRLKQQHYAHMAHRLQLMDAEYCAGKFGF